VLAPISGQSLGTGDLLTASDEIDLSRVPALAGVEAAPVAPITNDFAVVHDTPHWSVPSMREFLQGWWVALP
jgi:hypothetical protein